VEIRELTHGLTCGNAAALCVDSHQKLVLEVAPNRTWRRANIASDPRDGASSSEASQHSEVLAGASEVYERRGEALAAYARQREAWECTA
jgi:hypothetical protein